MRLSVDKSDPGYAFLEARGGPGCCDVFLDGQKLDLVETADDVEGIAVVIKRDGGGRIRSDPTTGEVPREILRGLVVIRFKPGT